jgi:hypothetical protein
MIQKSQSTCTYIVEFCTTYTYRMEKMTRMISRWWEMNYFVVAKLVTKLCRLWKSRYREREAANLRDPKFLKPTLPSPSERLRFVPKRVSNFQFEMKSKIECLVMGINHTLKSFVFTPTYFSIYLFVNNRRSIKNEQNGVLCLRKIMRHYVKTRNGDSPCEYVLESMS